MGAPQSIVQNDDIVVFLYAGSSGAYRMIPIDGRELTEAQIYDFSWLGNSTGHWEGDVLVVESRGFSDQSWLGWAGWIHSKDMVVTERVWREEDTLHWIATVEDPMLLKPWTTHEARLPLNTDPTVFLWETPPCEELDLEHMVENTRG